MKPQPCKITNKNTLWVFLTASNELRHLQDVILGVDCLRKKGISDKDIFLFLDHPEKEIHLSQYSINKNVYDPTQLSKVLAAANDYELVAVVVGGHGSSEGIATTPVISPKELLSACRSIPKLKGGLIVLGQCYAGLFNYSDAGLVEPQFVILGATNLNPSLSYTIDLDPPIKKADGHPGIKSWGANIFLVHFMNWVKSPKDVDCDGKLSVVDAYRYAGVKANEQLRKIKGTLHFEIEILKSNIQKHLQQGAHLLGQDKDNKERQDFELRLHAIQRALNDEVELLYLHQEPWLLHSFMAQDFCF